ncbi:MULTISPECIES: tetratricopeptide repeat protein [Chryseobacterium]|uniref:Cell division protein FtsL n=1 Tax=Chryseobacterium geocarposphaerae TaxID=1416776 RepID=A0ABU1LH93_9FLAO|nr:MULTISPECIES: tetratricopeptide repeat protein [Chryseobacterium]MDR6406083.1 cell division protein FtsL [Chryseobacterium geocarposphaerae]MDR6699443.1 cell division protein FtsL/DNA-binding CsgD family transcriptional regulator [Chryseobacterium ginsenosidimutans]
MEKLPTFYKSSIILLIFLFSNLVFCQNKQLKEIDKLLNISEKRHAEYKDFEELQIAKRANLLAQKTGDSKRIAESSYLISRALSCLELQKQSLSFIQKTFDQKYTQEDILLQAKLKEIKSYNFYVLSLKSQSLREQLSIIKLLKDKKDTASIRVVARTYGNIGNRYFDRNKLDSAFIYYKLSGNLLKKLDENKAYNSFSEHYIALGNAFSQKKDFDSAFYYYQKSYELKLKYKDPILFVQYMIFGNYYKNQKKYDLALDYYVKAIQNIEKYSINMAPFNSLYKNISEIYGILGDKNKQSEYETIYINEENKIASDRSKSMDYALNIIIDDQENNYQHSKRKKYIWISAGILLLIIIFIVVFNILRKNLKHKETLFTEVHSTLQEKEEIISQKTVETEELQLKVNDAYNEVIDLAKKNDPSFYFRFQEVYPDFQKKLMEYSPGLRTSELILCAYTFLGFTIKDIADYTYKSINTVRNRKQNLRKKFLIPTEQDMGIWLRNLTNKKTS